MKPGTAKSKGRETEQAYCDYVQFITGLPVERRRLGGTLDRGDVAGLNGITVEIKSGGVLAIPGWLAELNREMHNDGSDMGHLAVRPRGCPNPARWWAIQPLPMHLDLLHRAHLIPLRRSVVL